MDVVVFIVIVVIAGTIFCRCEWAYHAALDEKDWTMEFLRVQVIEIARRHDEARKVAAPTLQRFSRPSFISLRG